MEKTRVSIFSRIKDFLKSITSTPEGDMVEENSLSKEDKELLKSMRENDNVSKIEESIKGIKEELRVKPSKEGKAKLETTAKEQESSKENRSIKEKEERER